MRTDLHLELASYFEGALTEVTVTKVGGDQPTDPFPPTATPWTRSWNDLPAGRYVVRAAMRPCAGDCGNLDPPTDTCRQTVALQENAVVRVDFKPGRPCTLRASADNRPEAGQADPQPIDLPTNDWQAGDLSQLARIAGVLAVDDNDCVYLASSGAARTYVTWPAGYTATIDTARHVTLYDPDGAPVAGDGDQMNLGGSYTAEAAGGHPCLPHRFGDIGAVMGEPVGLEIP